LTPLTAFWGIGSLSGEVLPIHRTTIGLFLVDFFYSYDDVNQCYITGNNSQSYSGY
jgi:hypothetical protein